MTNAAIKSTLWWICLLVAPLVLAGIELFHPAGFTRTPGMFAYLCRPEGFAPEHWALNYPGPQWWFLLHMIQTPMVALVTVGLWLMLGDLATFENPFVTLAAWIARAAALVFLIYYTVLDGIGGIGLGRTILVAQDLLATGKLTADQFNGVSTLLNTVWVDPWIGGVGSFISLTGSWAIFVAACAAALALALARRAGVIAVVLMLAFGWELQTSHASPHGPMAFALLIAFGLWLRLFDRRWHVRSDLDRSLEPRPAAA